MFVAFFSITWLVAGLNPLADGMLIQPRNLSAFSGVSSTLTLPQAGRNAINGTVSNTSGKPLYRMRVELQNEVEMMVMQTYTDATGRYNFKNLSAGTFIVKVHSDGTHISQSVRVNLYAARSGGGAHYEQVDFLLKTRSDTKSSSVPTNTGATFVQEVPESARKIYERAVKQLDSKQIDQGIGSLKEAINIFPTYFLALERLGVEYVKRQEYQSARESLLKAVDVNSSGAAAQYALGVAQFNLHQIQESAESLRRSLLLAPESSNAAFAHFYLGLAFWKLNKPADAEPHLRKCYELGGSSVPADIHLYMAKHYSDTHRYKEAADALELFLKLAPDARDAENIRNLIKKLRAKA